MTSKDIAEKIVEAVKAAPEVAQELIADPRAAVARVAGAAEGFDLTEVVQEALALAADLRLDLSCVDLGKLDLSQIDVAKLDLVRLAERASACNVDMTSSTWAPSPPSSSAAGSSAGGNETKGQSLCLRAFSSGNADLGVPKRIPKSALIISWRENRPGYWLTHTQVGFLESQNKIGRGTDIGPGLFGRHLGHLPYRHPRKQQLKVAVVHSRS